MRDVTTGAAGIDGNQHEEAGMAAARTLSMVVAFAVTGLLSGQAWAGPPSEQLRDRVDAVIRVLVDPALKGEGRAAERRAGVRRIANEIFDFAETTRRSLGRHWQARTPAEQAELVALFTDLLERTYVGRIEAYSGEKIQYLGDTVDGTHATVRTKLITRQETPIPVDYRMHLRNGRWLAYDVTIEGISLVGNYRGQFNRILQTSSYAGLVEKLRAKQVEGLEAAASARPASQK
jgi:phospholipid transport system substrate-binding protein